MSKTLLLHVQGESLWARLSASHGYLNKQGYCDGGNTLGSPSGNCHLFPVIWGETGTGFTVSVSSQQAVLGQSAWKCITRYHHSLCGDGFYAAYTVSTAL